MNIGPHISTVCSCGAPATDGTYAGNLCMACRKKLPPMCDFCSFHAPAWVYHCAEIIVGEPHEMSGWIGRVSPDAWGACEVCHDLIEKNSWNVLAERSLSSHNEVGIYSAILAVGLKRLHREFRKKRTGAAYRETKDECQDPEHCGVCHTCQRQYPCRCKDVE